MWRADDAIGYPGLLNQILPPHRFSDTPQMLPDRLRIVEVMRNEVYCKLICHNVCCVIQSQCELGIEPVFWLDDSSKDVPLLKFPRA
jgi:hypothetical protein